MPHENTRFLGCFMHFWGYKQETTHTWFSLLDKYGAKSEPINIIKYLWTGKPFNEPFPMLNYMLVNSRGACDNIILKPGESVHAELNFLPARDRIKIINWLIFREDWFKINDMNSTQFLLPVDSLASTGQTLEATLKVPAQEGPYRIFATVYNHNGNFATANTPFYVTELSRKTMIGVYDPTLALALSPAIRVEHLFIDLEHMKDGTFVY